MCKRYLELEAQPRTEAVEDEMDRVWHEMSDAERAALNERRWFSLEDLRMTPTLPAPSPVPAEPIKGWQ